MLSLIHIFDNINDQERFIRLYQNDIVRFSFVNYNGKNGPELVSTVEPIFIPCSRSIAIVSKTPGIGVVKSFKEANKCFSKLDRKSVV